MPYTASSENLPSNVKKMSENKRKQWVEIFNSCIEAGDDEATAFKKANGGVKKKGYPDSWDVTAARVTQEQAEYNPFGASDTEGCANCNWFISPDSCADVTGDISPAGICKLYMKEPQWEPYVQPVRIVKDYDEGSFLDKAIEKIKEIFGIKAVWTTAYVNDLPDSCFLFIESGGKKVGGKTEPRSLRHFPYKDSSGKVDLPHLRNAIARIPQSNAPGLNKDAVQKRAQRLLAGQKDDSSPIVFYKSDDGSLRFFATVSNIFRDRQAEIITTEAHREYIEWVDKTKAYPKLWLWHAGPNSEWGQVDWVDFADGFYLASGTVTPGKEYIAEALENQDVGVSHGFVSIPVDKNIIRYRDFEISALPREYAANIWTDFSSEEITMPFTDAKKTWLKDVAKVPDNVISEWESNVEGLSKSLKDAGIDYKETVEPNYASEIANLTKVVADLATVVTESKKSADAALAEAKKSMDDKIADAFTAQVAKMPQPVSATESQTNVIGKKEEPNKDMEWFFKEVVGGIAK